MKKKGRKVILFLVEGSSDMTSLEFIDKLSDEKIKFYITSGDITSKLGVNNQNCILEINEHLKNFIKRNKLKKSDILKIIHIIDTDGCYINDKYIAEKEDMEKLLYSTKGIIGNSKIKIVERNKNKRAVLDKLLSTQDISKIEYKVYYMSCNLEHVLHDKLENLSIQEKTELANKFADMFYEKEFEFIKFINTPVFKVIGNYKETWEFIKQDLNSVKRYSNLWLFFNN